MTVRWKPLIILSVLFLVIGLAGFAAIMMALPSGSRELLALARVERDAGKWERAAIQYRRALQSDPNNASIHLELAELYQSWAQASPAAKRPELVQQRVLELLEAVKHDRQALAPRQELMIWARERGDRFEAVRWAREITGLEPANAEAHYVLAASALDEESPDAEQARKSVELLQTAGKNGPRLDWLRARLAKLTHDQAKLDEILGKAMAADHPPAVDPNDRLALVQLRAMASSNAKDAQTLAAAVDAVQPDAQALIESSATSPDLVIRLARSLNEMQRQYATVTPPTDPTARTRVEVVRKSLDELIVSAYEQSMKESGLAELDVAQAYALYLFEQDRRTRCLEVVDNALKSPMAQHAGLARRVFFLHEIAIRSALSDSSDPKRFELAEPHIRELLGQTDTISQGVGHLYQGAIDLERSGLIGGNAASGSAASSVASAAGVEAKKQAGGDQAELRREALTHLKIAAANLPQVGGAQALYGVSLIMTREPGLGRQYLQKALRLGNIEPKHQIWAAWSMLRAGYSEDAEGIANQLIREIQSGKQPKQLLGMLLVLRGEILQSRQTPADLRGAWESFSQAVQLGYPMNPQLQMNLARIEVMLGKTDEGMRRLDQLKDKPESGSMPDQLAVQVLVDKNDIPGARARLAKARERSPNDDDLVMLEAALDVQEKKFAEADTLLDQYLKVHPGRVAVVQARASVLADYLDKPKDAVDLLTTASERSDSSAPLVQLAQLHLKRDQRDAAARVIAQLRSRWSDSAAPDLLEAQLAMAKSDWPLASNLLGAAIEKDPTNRLARFWKARIDSRGGSDVTALSEMKKLASENLSKELFQGISLKSAAENELARMALRSGDIQGAIERFENLAKSSRGELTRVARWSLVEAYELKNDWPHAKAEIEGLLNDPKAPPTTDELIRGAISHRRWGELDKALALVGQALKNEPDQVSGLLTQVGILADQKKSNEAAERLRAALGRMEKPPIPIFLAMAEVESALPPPTSRFSRASAVLTDGLKVHPNALPLIEARYRLARLDQGPAKALDELAATVKASDGRDDLQSLLVDILREEREFVRAEKALEPLIQKRPEDGLLAVTRIKLILAQMAMASGEASPTQADKSRTESDSAPITKDQVERVEKLVTEARAKFPKNAEVLEAECELAIQVGDLTRADRATAAMDVLEPNSPLGPRLRSRILAARGRTSEAAEALVEAVRRSPFSSDLRLSHGIAALSIGDLEAARQEADWVLERDPNNQSATLLKARALAGTPGNTDRARAARTQARELLATAVAKWPKLSMAYHRLADLQLEAGQRAEAVATLQTALKNVPNDGAALSSLIHYLAEPRGKDQTAPEADLKQAQELAKTLGASDTRGSTSLSLALGFYRAGQIELGLPWARKAIELAPVPPAHLTYGDMLLTQAEQMSDPAKARPILEEALKHYDQVLALQPLSIEAVNNKAWILSRHLDQHEAALKLVMEVRKQVDANALPGEFFDTLGTIQEQIGQIREAEESYSQGLRRSPEQPILNFHMGRLLAKDRARMALATEHLNKAKASVDKLPSAMIGEIDEILKSINR